MSIKTKAPEDIWLIWVRIIPGSLPGVKINAEYKECQFFFNMLYALKAINLLE